MRPVEDRPVLRGYEEYADLPEDAPVRVYALAEIAVEKLVALTDKARNEPRDLYDLWHLTREGLIDFGTLIPRSRRSSLSAVARATRWTAELAPKEARYKKLWAVCLGQQMATLPQSFPVGGSKALSLGLGMRACSDKFPPRMDVGFQ